MVLNTYTMKKILLFLLLPLFTCNKKVVNESPVASLPFDTKKIVTNIAFGSCNKHDASQEMWQYVIQNKPELWIWLGDIIYGDTEDMDLLAEKYKLQKSHSEYQALLKQCHVVGIWDDHDYGVNDGGKEYPRRKESKKLLLDFLDVPANAAVRSREHGAFQSYVLGPVDKQVKVILLDARYFRDELIKDPNPDRRYTINATGDILGEAQWQWLEKELTESTAKVHIIGSGIQMIPEEHGWEKWANFPIARERFFDLLVKTKPAKPLLISGDRHIAELSKYQPEGLDYPIYEMTASGLTHTWDIPRVEANQHRVGEIIYQKNFSVLQLDWKQANPIMTVEVKGLNNESFMKEELRY
ncbi:MAG: alkaline phosphatase D [Saprospiraceae bacterium]